MKSKITVILVLLFISTQAQKYANHWYFGCNSAIDFNSGVPVVLSNSAMCQAEGCSSISDDAGNLLFYTDGSTVWNMNHVPMANGTGLGGNASSTQSALIVRQPSTTNYYIFTTDGFNGANGLQYNVVDMTQNGGLGAVTIKNQMLYTPTTERVSACTHANGVDVWILSHESIGGNFVAYLLTATGLAPGSVITNVGPVFTGGGLDFLGNLKFSAQGNRVAMAVSNPDYFWLFDFDRTTGVLSNPIQLQSTGNFEGAYGVEFSPNGNVLYGTSEIPFKFFQWDITSGVAATIDATRIDIPVSNMGSSYTGGLQMAPDGKIYMTRNTCTWLAVVNDPDVYGAGCNYADSGLFLNGGTCIYGLPNLNQSVYQQVLIDKFCIGDTTTFLVSDSLSYFAIQWDFGDPGSGLLNVAYNASASHYYASPGSYTVQLIRGLFVAPFSDTTYYNIEIKTCASVIANLSCTDTLFCDKQCIDFFDQSQFNPTSWQWTFTGASPSSSTDQNPTGICYNNYGAFDVQLIACNGAGCDTVLFANFINEFQLPPQPTVTSSNDTLYCNTTNVTFAWYNVNNPNLVLSTTNYFLPTQAGQYYVVITDSNDCEVASNVFTSTVAMSEIKSENLSINYNMETGQLTIEHATSVLENALLIIYDVTGRKLYQENIPNETKKYVTAIPSYNQVCIAQLVFNNQSLKLKLISK